VAHGRRVASGGVTSGGTASAQHALLIAAKTLAADSTPGDAEGPAGSVLGALRRSRRERAVQTPQQGLRFSFGCQQGPVLAIRVPSAAGVGTAGGGWWGCTRELLAQHPRSCASVHVCVRAFPAAESRSRAPSCPGSVLASLCGHPRDEDGQTAGVGGAEPSRALTPCSELLVSRCWGTAGTTLLLCAAQSCCAVPRRARRLIQEQFPCGGKGSCPPPPRGSGVEQQMEGSPWCAPDMLTHAGWLPEASTCRRSKWAPRPARGAEKPRTAGTLSGAAGCFPFPGRLHPSPARALTRRSSLPGPVMSPSAHG